jgi:Tat protein translocase TatB subunit
LNGRSANSEAEELDCRAPSAAVARTANPSQAENLVAQSPVSFERRFLMFDIDAGKLIIVGIVALIVIGPKELPRVMLQVGQAAAKMRRMAAEFRSQFMDAMREAEIDKAHPTIKGPGSP